MLWLVNFASKKCFNFHGVNERLKKGSLLMDDFNIDQTLTLRSPIARSHAFTTLPTFDLVTSLSFISFNK